jgi:PAS domain S-box-containing protein
MAYRCRNDEQWTAEFVSEGCLELTGYRPAELIDNQTVAYADLIHPDDQDDVWRDVQDALAEDRPFKLVYRIHTRNGREKWVWEQGRAVTTAEGQERLEGFITDITARKQAEDKICQSAARAEASARIAARLNAELDLQTVLNAVCEETARALDAPAASITLYDEKAEAFRIEATVGLPPEFEQRAQAIPCAVYEKYARKLGPVIVNPDVQAIRGLPDASVYTDLDIRTVVVATMERNGELIGGLNVNTFGEIRHFREDKLALLQGLADQAAQAITNARLYEQSQHRLRRLQALNAIDRAITARLDLPQTLDVVLEQVTTQLEVDAAMILLLDADEGVLKYAAGRGFHHDAVQRSRVPLGEGYSGRVAQQQESLSILDLSEAEGFVQAPLLAEEEFVSYCGVPLVAEDKVLGVLSVFQRSRLDLEEEWGAFLEALAFQAAIAIDSAGLYAETRRLLEKTRTQARQVQQIVDTMPEGVLLLDAQRRVILANPLGQTYLEQLAGARSGDVLTQLGSRPLAELLEPVEEGQPWHELAPRQSEQIFEVAAQPVEAGAEVGGWVLVLRNVTEERQRQEYMQTQDRLATVGQLAAGIAHDFNNIMAVISLYSQSLERNPEHPRRRDYLATMHSQAQRASELIGQILDFSRASTLERRCLDLLPFVKEVAKLLKRTLPTNVTFRLNAETGEFPVEADPTRLQQVLMNLAVNARDAMPEGGELSIGLSDLALAQDAPRLLPDMPPGEYVCLTVCDTGGGIPGDVLPHIFEPFFTTKSRGKGTGLGLAQVYGIVRQHEGVIDVQSEPGEGTVFSIYLPAAKAGSEMEAGRRPPSSDAAGGEERILLVEDDAATRTAIREGLTDLGYVVREAENGREALALLQRSDFDLVLSDMVMPEMGGQELYRQIRERRLDIPLIFTSGYPLQDRDNGDLLPNDVILLQKPFTGDELARTVRRVLDETA